MKTLFTCIVIGLGIYAGTLEIQKNPQRYPSFIHFHGGPR